MWQRFLQLDADDDSDVWLIVVKAVVLASKRPGLLVRMLLAYFWFLTCPVFPFLDVTLRAAKCVKPSVSYLECYTLYQTWSLNFQACFPLQFKCGAAATPCAAEPLSSTVKSAFAQTVKLKYAAFR